MFIRVLTTWTIYILLPLLLQTSSQGPVIPNNKVNESKTMWDALVTKCPNLESTSLKKHEILANRCQNWAEINTTSFFNSTTKPNVQCLVLYEAVLSFCTQIGDSLGKTQNLIPLTAQSIIVNLSSICTGENQLYPVNNTGHNISSLIQNQNKCFSLCLDLDNSEGGITDICKYAYYFTTFNVPKLLNKLKSIKDQQHSSHNLDNVENAVKYPPIEDSNKPRTHQVLVEPKNPGPEVSPQVPATKPKETVNDVIDQNKDANLPVVIPEVDTNQQKSVDVKQPEPQVQAVTKSNSPEPLEKIISAKNGVGQAEGPSLPKPQLKDKIDVIDSPQEPPPEKGKKLALPENAADDYPIEEKAQVGEGPDQEPGDPELEPEDGDVKAEPFMPDEGEPKEPPRKVKPSTVDDEAVNTFNTPDDDMNGDSYFFSYFTVIMCLFIVGYVGYHNRQKVLALILEGKKGRKPGRGRRPNSANYHKLDTNLEEAISSSCAKSASNVIY